MVTTSLDRPVAVSPRELAERWAGRSTGWRGPGGHAVRQPAADRLQPGKVDGFRSGPIVLDTQQVVNRVLTSGGTRAAAAATLLSQLEDLVVAYAGIPERERGERLARDADRITGEVARVLQAARRKITPAALP